MKKCLLLLLLTTLLPFPIHAADDSLGAVRDLSFKYSLNDTWSVFSRSQAMGHGSGSELFLGLVDAGVGYRLSENWIAGAAWRKVWHRPGDDWLTENRPLLEVAWIDRIAEIALLNRSRLEFRDFQWEREDDLRFRNKTRAELPWGLGGVRPYIEEEFFIGRNRGELELNWLTAGLYFAPTRSLKFRLGYRLASYRRDDGWDNVNQVVTDLGMRF